MNGLPAAELNQSNLTFRGTADGQDVFLHVLQGVHHRASVSGRGGRERTWHRGDAGCQRCNGARTAERASQHWRHPDRPSSARRESGHGRLTVTYAIDIQVDGSVSAVVDAEASWRL